MSLSTHILDTALGRPVPEVAVTLEQWTGGSWTGIARDVTDPDGRARGFPAELPPGLYRLHFETGSYFARQGVPALYPFVEISFTVAEPGGHLHLPLLLTANGYTTYRGS